MHWRWCHFTVLSAKKIKSSVWLFLPKMLLLLLLVFFPFLDNCVLNLIHFAFSCNNRMQQATFQYSIAAAVIVFDNWVSRKPFSFCYFLVLDCMFILTLIDLRDIHYPAVWDFYTQLLIGKIFYLIMRITHPIHKLLILFVS